MDYNRELKNRLVRKIEALDKRNGGDYKKTMQDMMNTADEVATYKKYTSVRYKQPITMHGIKGEGRCVINFTKQGNVLEYLY